MWMHLLAKKSVTDNHVVDGVVNVVCCVPVNLSMGMSGIIPT